jgi:hypothetical protein
MHSGYYEMYSEYSSIPRGKQAWKLSWLGLFYGWRWFVMAEYPTFKILLRRLAERRGFDEIRLSRLAGISEVELGHPLNGEESTGAFLRQLAPALNLHAEDLFVIANMELPDELTPLDSRAGQEIPQLVGLATRLSQEHVGLLRNYVRSLPQHDRTHPIPTRQAHERYLLGFGAILMGLLANRNLNWSGSAKVLSRLTNLNLAASTIGAIGHGRKEVNIDLVVAFSAVLGIDIRDLCILAEIDSADSVPVSNPAAAEIANLIWDLRRLTVGQIRWAREEARFMLGSA